MNDERFVIYGLHNGDSRVRYVGMTTVKLSRRVYEHKRTAMQGKVNRPLYIWMRKHGPDNVQAVILEHLSDASNLAEREIAWIAKLKPTNSLLNLTAGGECFLGYVSTPEHKANLSKALKGRPNTTEHNARIAQASLGNQKWRYRAIKEDSWAAVKAKLDSWYREHGYNPHQYAGHKSKHVNLNQTNPVKCAFCRDGVLTHPYDGVPHD